MILLLICIHSHAQISLQLTSPKFNGFNISCFGGSNGSIDLTISGGTPPYSINWSTNDTIEDLSGLPAGYYRVTVMDSDTLAIPAQAEITLTEPRELVLSASVYEYPNGNNISLYGACNGMVNLSGTEGVLPYTWSWSDGNTSQNRNSICANRYSITLTDANNCIDQIIDLELSQPDRNDWQISGNLGVNSISEYFGTADSTPLIIKTNLTERIRITANGELKIAEFQGSGAMVYSDSLGILRTGTPLNPVNPCDPGQIQAPVWYSLGSPPTIYTCPSTSVGVGVWAPIEKFHVEGNAVFSVHNGGSITSSPFIKGGNTFAQSTASAPDFSWYGNKNTGIFHPQFNIIAFSNSGQETMRMIYDATQNHGKVLIGSDLTLPTSTTYSYSLYVSRGILAEKVRVAVPGTNFWNDHVFSDDYNLMSLDELKYYIGKNKHLPDIPSAKDVVQDGIDLAEMNSKLLLKIEELTLYIIKLDEEIRLLKHKMNETK